MLDTLSMVKKLRSAGVPEEQAEAQVSIVYEAMDKGFATKVDIADLKGDMASLKAELKNDMADLKSELKGDMADLKSDMAKLEGDMAGVQQNLKGRESRLLVRLGGLIVLLMTAGFAFLDLALH